MKKVMIVLPLIFASTAYASEDELHQLQTDLFGYETIPMSAVVDTFQNEQGTGSKDDWTKVKPENIEEVCIINQVAKTRYVLPKTESRDQIINNYYVLEKIYSHNHYRHQVVKETIILGQPFTTSMIAIDCQWPEYYDIAEALERTIEEYEHEHPELIAYDQENKLHLNYESSHHTT